MTVLSENRDLKLKKHEHKNGESIELVAKYIGTNLNYTHKIDWLMTTLVVLLHFFSTWGLILIIKGCIQLKTILWMLFIIQLTNFGISIGSHRYYSHRSFKVKPILEVIFIVLHSMAGQFSTLTWVKNHRLHHRYSDTDADPHNSKRGLFYCYIGWIMTLKNKYVQELEKKMDMSDLLTNKLVMFQYRYFIPMHLLCCAFIPFLVPVYFFNEVWWHSLFVAYPLRYAIQLHYTFLVVILGHKYGTRPYDKNMQPTESWFTTIISFGDGNHNYHHVFPWDYKTAEGPNLISFIILFLDKIGLAYDLKETPRDMIKNKIVKTGDGTHHILGTDEGKSTTTAIGQRHPLNPTYRAIKDPEIYARIVGPRTMFVAELEDNVDKNVASK